MPFTGRPAREGEIAYAQFAERTPHVVLSRTLQAGAWRNTRIVRDVEEIRLVVQPVVLGRGKAPFKDVSERRALRFLGVKPMESGVVRLTYAT